VEDEDASVNKMIGQPDTSPISQAQLVAEVKGIYAGLVMCVSFCLELRLSAMQWANPNQERNLCTVDSSITQ
jgi:hypothetical protein